jgi:hypothetical protein
MEILGCSARAYKQTCMAVIGKALANRSAEAMVDAAQTTMIHTHALNGIGRGVLSPLDRPLG